MRLLIVIFLLQVSCFAALPDSVSNIIVKLKDGAVSEDITSSTSINNSKKTGIVTTKNDVFNNLSKKFKFKQANRAYALQKSSQKNLYKQNAIYRKRALRKSRKSKLYKKHNLDRVLSVSIEKTTNVDSMVTELESSGLFEYVAIPQAVSINATSIKDLYYDYQWSLESSNNAYSGLTPTEAGDLDMESAWDVSQGDSSTVVAILDTGNRPDHPDMSGRIWVNSGEIDENGIDDDGNGYIDDRYGWSFADNSGDIVDNNGHGTHVSGIVGANGDNGLNIVGMDWNCKIMAVKVLADDGTGNTSMWHDGMMYAVDNGADVINMSLGGEITHQGTIDYVQEAVDYAYAQGAMVVVSTGNDGSGSSDYYPAACDNVLAVGATGGDGTRASFSNYGSHVDVVAPGEIIWSLKYDDYSKVLGMSGTSQAAPHVSGLASLMRAQYPSASVDAIYSAIKSTATDMVGSASEDVEGFDQYYGYGLINPTKALVQLDDNSAPVIISQSKVLSMDENNTLLLNISDVNVTDSDDESLELNVKSGENYSFSGDYVTPDDTFYGFLEVSVTVSDGSNESLPFVLSIEVTEVNDAPEVVKQDGEVQVEVDEVFFVSGSYFDLYDEEGETVTVEVQDGENYEHEENDVYVDDGFSGMLAVNVLAFDGENYSENFVFEVTVGESSTATLDGDFTEENTDKLVIAPMPFSSSATAYYKAEETGVLDVFLYTLTEQFVKKSTRHVDEGENIIRLEDLTNIQRGQYYVVFKLNGKVDVVKLIVKVK